MFLVQPTFVCHIKDNFYVCIEVWQCLLSKIMSITYRMCVNALNVTCVRGLDCLLPTMRVTLMRREKCIHICLHPRLIWVILNTHFAFRCLYKSYIWSLPSGVRGQTGSGVIHICCFYVLSFLCFTMWPLPRPHTSYSLRTEQEWHSVSLVWAAAGLFPLISVSCNWAVDPNPRLNGVPLAPAIVKASLFHSIFSRRMPRRNLAGSLFTETSSGLQGKACCCLCSWALALRSSSWRLLLSVSLLSNRRKFKLWLIEDQYQIKTYFA